MRLGFEKKPFVETALERRLKLAQLRCGHPPVAVRHGGEPLVVGAVAGRRNDQRARFRRSG